jgi:hypothetical protein
LYPAQATEVIQKFVKYEWRFAARIEVKLAAPKEISVKAHWD